MAKKGMKRRKINLNEINIGESEKAAVLLLAVCIHCNGCDEHEEKTHTHKGHLRQLNNDISCLQFKYQQHCNTSAYPAVF